MNYSYDCPHCDQKSTALEVARKSGRCPGCEEPLSSIADRETFSDQKLATEENLSQGSYVFHDTDLNMNDSNEDKHRLVTLQITPVQGVHRDVESITQLMNTLGGAANPLIFEFSGTHLRRNIIIRCERQKEEIVRSHLTGLYGSPDILEITNYIDDPSYVFTDQYQFRSWKHLILEKPDALPIRTFREITHHDPSLNLISSLFGLQEGEAGLIQVIVRGPAKKDWSARYRQELIEIRRRRAGQLSLSDFFRILTFLIGFLGITVFFLKGEWLSGIWILVLGIFLIYIGSSIFFRKSNLEWSESLEESVMRKIDQPGYSVEIRIAAAGNTRDRVLQLVEVMSSAFRIFSLESGNGFCESKPSQIFHPSSLGPVSENRFILGDAELAVIWHLPLEILPDMLPVKKYDHRMIDASLYLDPGEAAWEIGSSQKDAGEKIIHRLPLSTIGYRNMILLGQTNVGKSTLLEHAVCAIAKEKRRSLVVIDPHRDMVERLLDLLPLERAKDVMYLNFADYELIPGFNLLDVTLFDGDAEKTAAAFIEVAHALYGKYWGPRMEVPFERVITALTLANTIRLPNDQFTVIDAIYLILMKGGPRKEFLEDILPKDSILSKAIINYFQMEFDTRDKNFNDQVISPVLSKLRPFESNSRLLAIFGQPKSTINPIHAIRDGKILLVRTGMEDLSEGYSNFIGSVFLNMAKRAILSQQNVDTLDRTRVTIVIDESQLFPGFDFGSALAMLRKFGGNFILTSQGEAFLGRARSSEEPDRPHAFKQIMSNVSTKVIFRLAGHDAKVISETEFHGEMDPQHLINLPDHTAFIQFSSKKQVWGPILVNTNPPIEPTEGIRKTIISNRHRYTIPQEHALEHCNHFINAIIARYPHRDIQQEKGLQAAQYHVPQSNEPIGDIPPDVKDALVKNAGIGLDSAPTRSGRDLAERADIQALKIPDSNRGDGSE